MAQNTLAYMDQASFLGLRALGHGPLIQFTWIYPDGLDLGGLQRFRRNLGRGLLARRIEPSPLPGGRHRWVAWPGPADIEISSEGRSADGIDDWVGQQAALPIDPENGPSWRLALLRLTDGGAVVTLVVSHTVADGVGAVTAVAEAARGVTRDCDYPEPRSRTKKHAVLQDARGFLRDLPDMARAATSLVRLARKAHGVPGTGTPVTRSRADGGTSEPVTVPSVTVHVESRRWDQRAAFLGGTPNSLLMAFAARLGCRLGWVTGGGLAILSVPVNERTGDDTRGNALNAVRVTVDPASVINDLSGVRAATKAALAELRDGPADMLGALPLIPLTPKFVARRIERMVIGTAVIGCTNVGEMDPAANRPDGTDAAVMSVRLTEQLTRADVRRSGGVFFPVGSGRVRDQVFVTVGYTDADASTTRGQLAGSVGGALSDLGIDGVLR